MSLKERILKRVAKNPYVLVYWLCKYSGLSRLSDYVFLKTHWRLHMGYPLDLESPRTFAEKLQWIKLYDRNPIYTTMVDKFAVKDYVANIIGPEYIIPNLGIWDVPEDIDFDVLPEQFVLKCNHDSGSLVICKDKGNLDRVATVKKLRHALGRNYYILTREWPYKNVKRRILAEPYLAELASDDLIDYKFFCINGQPCFCQVIKDRSTSETIDFFDMNWNHMNFIGLNPAVSKHSETVIKKPKNFEKMVEFAEKLSAGIPFVRVDFYNIDGKIYFGELTFFPANGMGRFEPKEWDKRIGEMLQLPARK